jgi:NAD(P)-dependent dehydrogenase (short-subunit alcohol dehydrogenase family)
MSSPSTPTRRVALITGTSSGIGLATAVRLACDGWRVVATMRNLARAEQLRDRLVSCNASADVRQLDITSDWSVGGCLTGVVNDYGRLDALVNNAAVGHVGTLETDTLEDFRQVIETNLIGTARVTRAALPHLRATAGHLLTISSVGAILGQPFNEAYCASKAGIEAMLEALAPLARLVGVRVSVVEPGGVATEFSANSSGPTVPAAVSAGPYTAALQRYLMNIAAAPLKGQDPYEVAAVVSRVLREEQPAFRNQTSSWARDMVSLKLSDLSGESVQARTRTWVGS